MRWTGNVRVEESRLLEINVGVFHRVGPKLEPGHANAKALHWELASVSRTLPIKFFP